MRTAPLARRAAPAARSPRAVRPGAVRRGAVLAEALVAAVFVAVGLLATGGVVAGATRAAARARRAERAAELLAERVAVWRGRPCVEDVGERVVAGLRERWHVAVTGGTAVLVDTVAAAEPTGPAPAATAPVGLVGVAACAP